MVLSIVGNCTDWMGWLSPGRRRSNSIWYTDLPELVEEVERFDITDEADEATLGIARLKGKLLLLFVFVSSQEEEDWRVDQSRCLVSPRMVFL